MKTAGLVVTFALMLTVGPLWGQEGTSHHPGTGSMSKADTTASCPGKQGSMMSGGSMAMMHGQEAGGQQMMRCPMCGQMMKGGMMGGMMGAMMGGMGMQAHQKDPLAKYAGLIQRLPELEEKLALSSEQSSRLKQLRADYLKKRVDWESAVKKKKIDLSLLLDEQASTSAVRAALKSLYDAKATMAAGTYETYQRVLQVLDEEQKSKLDKLLRHGGCEMMMHKKGKAKAK